MNITVPTPSIRITLCLCLAIVPCFPMLDAGEAEALRGAVLLRNDQVILGQAHQEGEFVVIRKGPGSEIRLSRTKVACWASCVRDLYQYRLDQREGPSIENHLADARWCLDNELLDLASAELNDAKKLNRRDRRIGSLESHLRRLLVARMESPVEAEQGFPRTNGLSDYPAEVEPASHQASVVPPAAVDRVSLAMFAKQVQSTLANRCGNCHQPNRQREWTLWTPPGNARPSGELTRKNLIEAIRFLDMQRPADSELLRMAITPHGGGPAPLNHRHEIAVAAIEDWMIHVARVSSDSQPIDRAVDRRAYDLSAADDLTSGQSIAQPALSLAELPLPAPAQMPIATPMIPTDPVTTEAMPSRLPTVENPFDPELFNRQFHR